MILRSPNPSSIHFWGLGLPPQFPSSLGARSLMPVVSSQPGPSVSSMRLTGAPSSAGRGCLCWACEVPDIEQYLYNRKKFRSQTSDNMDRWKSRDGKSQRREGKKKEDQKRESLRRKKIQVWSPLKRRVRSPLGRWEMKNCTRLWREAHFEVKMYKTHQVRTTFGSWDVDKVQAVVARSTCRSQKCKKLSGSEHFWKLRCRKIARRCGAKHISKSKVEKNCGVRSIFGRSDALSRGRRKGLCTLSKWAKRVGFVAFPKTMAVVGHLTRICKDGFRVAGAVQETCWSEMLGGQGADFLREVAFWSIRSSGLLRWFCVTGAALRMTWHHFLVLGAVL